MDITKKFLQDFDISDKENQFGSVAFYNTFSSDEHGNMIILYQSLNGKTPLYFRRNGDKWQKPYTRIRFAEENMPVDEKGKKVKYKTQFGAQSEVFFNGLLKYFPDLQKIKTLVVTEGEKKAFVACKNAIPSVGIQGIHNLVRKRKDAVGNTIAIDFIESFCDLLDILTSLEKIILLFDADCRLGSNERKTSFSSAVLNFKECAKKHLNVQIYFSHIKDELVEKAKGIDDLLFLEKKSWQVVAEDLLSINIKSQFFNFIDLVAATNISITKYFQIDVLEKKNITIEIEFIKKCFFNVEQGDGELLAKIFKNEYAFDQTENCWLKYENGAWKASDKIQNDLHLFASEKVSHFYRTYLNMLDEDVVDLCNAKEKKLKTWKYASNVVNYAKSYLSVDVSDFDKNIYHVNLKNGYYDLESKTFFEHSNENRFKKQLNANYVEDAKEPLFFKKFLQDIFLNDVETIRFIWKWLGLCLSGNTDFQAFIYCFGHGRNGKSTFFSMLKALFNTYYQTIPINILLDKKIINSTDEYYKAQLLNARIVVPSEVPRSAIMNESMIKDLTGCDEISARFIYAKPFTFRTTHKLALFGNHKLVVKSQDEGIWRRIVLLHFEADFANVEVKTSELLKNFEKEKDEVFMWLLKGYEKYKEEGLQKPQKILQNINQYRQESDLLLEFLEEKTEKIGYGVRLRDLFKLYVDYCKEINEEMYINNPRQMAASLRERGYEVANGKNNQMFVKNISLK